MFTFGINIKNSILTRRNITLGLIFVLLVVALFCGHFQVLGLTYSGSMFNMIGMQTIFSVSDSGQSSVFFSIFLLMMAASLFVLFALAPPGIRKNINNDIPTGRIFSNTSHFIFKLFDSLLRAFRKGIVHSKEYNFSLVVN